MKTAGWIRVISIFILSVYILAILKPTFIQYITVFALVFVIAFTSWIEGYKDDR